MTRPRLAAVLRHGILEENSAFIAKPFSAAALAHKIREVLCVREPA